MVSKVKVSNRQTQAIIEAEKIQIQKMATEQTNITGAIVQAVAEAKRAAVQALSNLHSTGK